jgi:S1-C subfamily serine protease
MRYLLTLILSLCIVGLLASSVSAADLITLKDGTVLQGDIRRSGGMYRVATVDGQIKFIPAADVVSINGKPVDQAGPTAPGNTPSTPDAKPGPAAVTIGSTLAFKEAKQRADQVEDPIIAVTLWENFIDKNAKNADLELAKEELKVWQQRQKDKAEKIRGKWVGGDELKKMKEDADKLFEEAIDNSPRANGDNGTRVRGSAGLRKLEEAIKIYPRHWQANFELGYYYILQAFSEANRAPSIQQVERGIRALETTRVLAPKVPEIHSNLAYAYAFRRQHEKAIMSAYRAVKLRDSATLVQVLYNVIDNAPQSMKQANPRLRPVLDDLVVLQRRHNISGPSTWIYHYPDPNNPEGVTPPGGEDDSGPPGLQGSGSGFFISPDGYILTNKHVAEGKPGYFYRIRMDDGKEMNAEFIANDPDQDIALLKVKPREDGTPYDYLKVADDNPFPAAQALVLGYPATGENESTLQINSGSVKSIHPTDKDFHIWFDLSTTHGNSGGPIVDRAGRVIGILSAGRKIYDVVYVFGIGPNQIESFLGKISDKAPSITYAPPPGDDVVFNGERLGKECRKSTVLVLIIKGEATQEGDTKSSDEKSPEGAAPGGKSPGGADAPSDGVAPDNR